MLKSAVNSDSSCVKVPALKIIVGKNVVYLKRSFRFSKGFLF